VIGYLDLEVSRRYTCIGGPTGMAAIRVSATVGCCWPTSWESIGRNDMSKNDIALSDVIVDLRRELLKAQEKGRDQDLKFRVEDIEVELQVTATKEAGAEGGGKFWVYNAKAQGKLGKQSVQKLKFKLKPETADDKPLKVKDKGKKPQD
jgi:hypothetical protein